MTLSYASFGDGEEDVVEASSTGQKILSFDGGDVVSDGDRAGVEVSGAIASEGCFRG